MGKDYEDIHRNNVEIYAKQIAAVFDSAVKEGASIGALTSGLFNPDKPFSFADYPITKVRFNKLTKSLVSGIEKVVLNGIDHEWTLSNNKNSELSRMVFGDNIGKLSKEQEERYFSNNHKARDTFKARKTDGLGLSTRVWKYSEGFKEQLEAGIDIGLRDRLSASDMARDIKQYLVDPDRLYRRVRDIHGNLQLSKAAKAFHPGQGVYRSSVRNAQRLARTETNMAYRTADYERWQQLDFVVGIEVYRSNKGFECPTCNSLKGKYPKDFKFTGWHTQCMCSARTILKTAKEMKADNERMLRGEPLSGESKNSISDVNKGFSTWIKKNTERINKGSSVPYFIRDNYVDGKISKGLKFASI